MNKTSLLYLLSFVLLLAVLYMFNRTYQELIIYSQLVNRHNAVHSAFQNFSKQINNAAILDPEIKKINNEAPDRKMFFTDSLVIIAQLNELKSTVRDSVNIRICTQLDTVTRSELSWLLSSNVPDSVIHNRSPGHIAKFRQIVSLVDEGIERTNFLIAFRKTQLNKEIKKMRIWTIMFIILSAALLLYTTINLFRQQSKRKIREKELAAVFSRINDGVVSVDNYWRYTFLNDAALATHPMTREETLGKVIWDVHPQMKGTVFWTAYHQAMETRKVIEIQSFYDPMRIWFSVKVYPSTDGLTIFYKDITEIKKAEQQLSETLKEVTDYKFALDESSIVAITDQKGIIKYVNDNFCKISKYSREELLGQDHRMINSGYHPHAFIRNLWTTIAGGKIWKGELKNKAKDKTVYWVDTTIVPFLDENKKPYQYVAIRADITERKEAEEKLVKSEKIYKTIASSIPGSVICLIDTDYRYLLIEGDMLEKIGYSKEQLLGKKAEDVLPPETFFRVQREFRKTFNGETVTHESSSHEYDIISRYIPLKDENDVVYMIMTVAIDITELKNAQRSVAELNRSLEEKIILRTAQLKKSNEELEAFSYSVSHDLRAPLRGIIGFSAMLEEQYGMELDDEGKRIITVIKNNTLKMGNLIDDLLAFSRMGKQAMVKIHIDTQLMIKEIIAEIAPSAKPVNWIISALPSVYADRNTIRQVWINLISNAVKYSGKKEHARIEIGSHHEKDQVVFFVRDNGAGFNEQYRDKLFKVFQRLHSSKLFEGTGVGLALVEKIISRHGGTVWAEGKEEEGACFYFSLPIGGIH
jgi:PAS domain S-box-containing protein